MRFLCWEITYVGFDWWSLHQEIVHHLEEGNKITAIRRYKEVTGKSLVDCKKYVDRIQEKLNRDSA